MCDVCMCIVYVHAYVIAVSFVSMWKDHHVLNLVCGWYMPGFLKLFSCGYTPLRLLIVTGGPA